MYTEPRDAAKPSFAAPRRLFGTLGKGLAWLLAALLVLLAATAILALVFDWNRARPWVDDKVTQAIGRPFAINGDLRIGFEHPVGETGWRAWVPWPRFTARDITIGNPDWTRSPHFATLDEIRFEVEVLPLLVHTIVIPSIELTNPSVDLERRADGRDNWTFNLASSGKPKNWTLHLGNLAFAKGSVAVSDAQKRVEMQIGIDTLGRPIPLGELLKEQRASMREASAQRVGRRGASELAAQASHAAAAQPPVRSLAEASSPIAGATASTASASSAATSHSRASASEVPASAGASGSMVPAGTARKRSELMYALGWTAKGRYNGAPITGSGKLGSVLALNDVNRPFPLQADVRIGDAHLALVGTLTDPEHLAALDLRLWLSGDSLSNLYSLTGITLPQTPPFATDGRLVGRFKADGNVFSYRDFTGRIGGSDIDGTMTYTGRKPRPLLQGELVSNVLRFPDLAPIVGADSNASKRKRGEMVKQPANRAIPVEPFHTDRWKAMDADVKFKGKRIIKNPDLPITNLDTHVVMKDGVLSLEPLNFGVAGGTLSSDIHLDGSAVPLKARLSSSARHLLLKQLFPKVTTMQSALGEINGDASLSATGNSPAALAATANGEMKALVTQGTVSLLLMEAAGLNVANVVYEKLFGTHNVKINCAAADFVATNGVLDSRVFALDTQDAIIDMQGHIDLRSETMDLGIHPHTKGFRIFTFRSPLYVKGTFKKPDVGVNPTALALRAAAAVGLGFINPFAALIPLIAPSDNKPLPCGELLAHIEKAPSAPPPGKQQMAKPPLAVHGTPIGG